jgi:2-oxoglutarate dehydrogenase complex dehydrogenase (E1) component-like enzyme
VHSRLQNFFCKPRQAKLDSKTGLDWATAESLAIGSLLLESEFPHLAAVSFGSFVC